MKTALAKTHNEQMMDVVRKFKSKNKNDELDLDALAEYAISEGLWEKHQNAALQMCKKDFSRALREQYHEDPQGRKVRTYHAAKKTSGGEQMVFWGDMRDALKDHMGLAFQQRRNQIVGDCRQLKNDVESYNDNNSDGAHIQMIFDFASDLAEMEQPAMYHPNQPR